MCEAANWIRSKRVGRAIGAMLLLAGMAVLSGCAGVSSAGSSSPPPSGDLSLAASSLDFAGVTAGSSKTLTVNATNTGSASVTISSATFTTKYFSLTAPQLPMVVAAGQQVSFSIAFTPNATGTFDATLTLVTGSSSSVSLSLSGTGMSAEVGLLATDPASESFGTFLVGTQTPQTFTLTNTGGAAVNVTQASISGGGFQLSGIAPPLTLNPSQSTTFTVTFAPTVAGSFTGTVTITSDASNPTLTVPVSGSATSPGVLGASPATLSFGNVTVGNNQSLSETVTNSGGSTVTISQATASGTGFSLSGLSLPVTIPAGQSVPYTVTFSPQSTGSSTATLTFTSNAQPSTTTESLSGTGTAAVGQLSVSPPTLNVGSVTVGTSGSGSGTLSASGASVTVTAASTNNSAFTVSGLSLPVTIPAGQSVPYTVTFSPQSTGSSTATLTFTSNAQPSTTTESLSGTGTAAPTYSVNLAWQASGSEDISGYNIYRAAYTTSTASCGSFSKINLLLNTTTLYTDTVVIDGSAYCYATTSVNTSNQESGYSNIVSNIQIPAP
jgi:hypothetical protein